MRVIKDNEREKTKHRRPRRIYSSSSSNTSSSDDSNIEYVRKRRRSHTSKRLIYTWSGNLKSMAVCMAYLIFFALVAVQYYIVAAWALSSNSKLATQSRATLARLMAQSIDALLLHVAEEPAKAGVTELENVKDNKIFDRKTTDDDPRKSIEDRRTMPVPKPALALNSALNRTSAVRAAYYPSLFGTYAYSDDGGNSSTDSSSSVVHRPSGVYSRGNRTLVGPVKSNQRDESPWYRHRPRPTTGIVYSDEDIANDYVFPQRQITFYPDTERAERRGLEYREPLSTYRSRSYRPREERDSNLKGHERSRETPLVRRKSSLERDNSLLKGHKPSSETPLVRRKSSFERTRPNPVIDPDYQDNLYEPRRQRSGIDRGFTRDAPIVINRIGGVETGVRRRPDSWLDDEVYWPGRAETPIRYRTILNTDTRRGQSSAHDAGLEEELRHKIEREIDLGVERGMEDELSRIKRQNRQRSTLPEERVVAFWPGHRDERPVVTTRPRDSGVTRERPEYYETRDFSDTYEFEGRPRPRPHYIPDDELRIQQLRAREAQIRDEIRDLELQEQRKFEKKRMEDEMFAKAKSEAEGRLREYENKELDNVRWERSRHERKERSYREPKLRGESGGWNFDIPEPPSSPSDTSDTSRSSEVLTAHERRMRQKGKELNQLSSPKPKDSASRTGKVWRNHGWKQEPTDGITITPITTYEERYQGALVKYEGSPNEVEEESINGGIIRRVTAEETSDEEFEPDAPARTRALDPDGDEIIKELSADEIGDLYD